MIQKVTLLLFVLLGTLWSHSSFAQNCVPNDNCVAAPKICMQGYIGNTKEFTLGSEPKACIGVPIQKPGPDGWIAFMPTQGNIEIYLKALSANGKLRAYIYSDCNSDPIDCSGLCDSLSKVGKNIVFTPGATYYLRIEACEGKEIPYLITYSPDGSIMNPPDAINPKWSPTGLILGTSIVDCPGKIATFTLPLNPCATSYHWTIESGEAEIINDFGSEYVDNYPLQPGTTVTITGNKRNVVRVRFNGNCPSPLAVRICCEGNNGCNTTNKTCKNIIVNCPPNDNKSVTICPQDSVWIDPVGNINGAFFPGSPCGTPGDYTVIGLNDKGCSTTIHLKVTKNCDEFGLIEEFDNMPIVTCEKLVKVSTPSFSLSTSGGYMYFITDSIKPNGGFGRVFEWNQTGEFAYNNFYDYEKKYYIVFIIGEKTPTGYVNLASNCLRYNYRTVQFMQKPVVSCIPVLPPVCSNSVRLNATKDSGNGKWVVLSQVPNSTISFSDKSDPNALFTADLEGTYKLQWYVENQACFTTCETEVTFKKEGPKAEKTKYTCNASGTSYTVSIKLNGIAPMKVLKGSSKGLLIGNTFTSFPIVTGKPYYLFVKDGQNCDTLKLSGTYLCPEYNGDLLNVEEREQIEEDIQFSLQPNPAKDVLQLQWNGILERQTGKLELVDMTGRVVQSVVISAQEKQHQMDVRTLPQGNYIVRILFGDVLLQEKLLISRE